ncbi:hypothetical protein F4820DRAFT_453796 [Hypoxylon rubiginosum]|uniref:Uncharacterized protein n=1 Tax=Hypoxylon rubiginosum TaxID=110542 RepID=A0ACB9YKA1_9PEZI|nr:hypothetical protein F4820DRAFT_453796 [Hypoxylon rubiginosum]
MASGQRNRVNALPTAFKCAIDGQWHEPNNFSQKQLAKWFQKKKAINDGVTPENVGLVCKRHSGQPDIQEIKCHGPCSAWKFKEHFSKNQRKDPEPWCIVCTSWTFQFGGTEVPLPPPSSKLSTDEIIAQTTVVHDRLPSMPVGDPERGSGPGYGARINGGGKSDIILETAKSMMRGVSSYGDGTADNKSTNRGDKDNKGVINRLPAPSHAEKARVEAQTTFVQQSATRTTFTGQSDSARATSSIAPSGQPTQTSLYNDGSLGPHSKKSVVTRGQSSAVTVTKDQATDLAAPQEISGDTPREAIRSTSFAQATRRWPKGDNRKVFYVPPVYAGRPEDYNNTDDPEWSDDDF